MLCTDGCCIAYHSTCWRKFKSDCVVGADRELLSSACPTPDCEGLIKTVSVHGASGAIKLRVGCVDIEADVCCCSDMSNSF